MIPLDFFSDLGLLTYGAVNPSIRKVLFNPPATIVFWTDETKTVVKCDKTDTYDEYTGLLLCIAKKFFGNTGKYNDILNHFCPEEERTVERQKESTIFENGKVKDALNDTIHRLTDDMLISTCYELNHWRIPNYLIDIIKLPAYITNRFSSLPKSVAKHTISPLMYMVKDEIAHRYCELRLNSLDGKSLNDKEDSEEVTWEEYIGEH